MTLLKAGFFEIWLIRTAPFLKVVDNEIIDFGGPEDHSDKFSFRLSDLQGMGLQEKFWETLYDFVRNFNSLDLIKEELAIFTSIIILCAGKETILGSALFFKNLLETILKA